MGRGKGLLGGGAGGGAVEVPGSRPAIVTSRVKTTNKTVGEGLYDTLANMREGNIQQFGQVLQSVAREVDGGDTRAAQTYALALSQLAVKQPGKFAKIVEASGIPPQDFFRYFRELEGPPAPVKDVSDAEALAMAEDAPTFNAPNIDPELVPRGDGVTGMSYDPSTALSGVVGGELSAQGMPVVEREPLVSPHSWAHFLGGKAGADATRFNPRARSEQAMAFPQLARFENIRMLREAIGLPIEIVAGGPRPTGPLAAALEAIERGQATGDVSYDFSRKPAMRPDARSLTLSEMGQPTLVPSTDPNVYGPLFRAEVGEDQGPVTSQYDFNRVADMRTQQLLDRMPAGTYSDEVVQAVRDAISGGEVAPDAAPVEYVGSSYDQAPDPNLAMAMQADEDVDTTADAGIDPNLLGSLPVQRPDVSPLVNLLSAEDAKPVWTAPPESPFAPWAAAPTQFPSGVQGYVGFAGSDTSDPARRAVSQRKRLQEMQEQKSSLEKVLEENERVLRGQAPLPRPLQGLLSRGGDGDEFVRQLLVQNAGSFYDADNRFPNWRRGVVFGGAGPDAPVTQLPFPPDVLAGLFAKQMNIRDPGVVAEMVAPMTNTIDVYGTFQPTGRAKAMINEQGFVQPIPYDVRPRGGANPMSAEQAAEARAMLLESLQQNLSRLRGMGRTPPIMFRTQPKQSTPIIDMRGASLLPEASRFDNTRVNPLMRLVG